MTSSEHLSSTSMDEQITGVVNACQYAMVAIQPDEVFRWIQLGLSILCSIVLLAYRLWKWRRNAKKDGKITEDEVDELVEIVKDGAEDIKSNLDKKQDNN